MSIAKRIVAATAIATSLAVGHEGLKFTPYFDPPGILTVCRGHTGPDVIKGKKYSLAECDAFLTEDMKNAIYTVEACQPGLPAPVLAAFADAVFNSGPKIACDRKRSTAARLLDANKLVEACHQLPRWNKARILGVMVELPGLTTRRAEEKQVCLSHFEGEI